MKILTVYFKFENEHKNYVYFCIILGDSSPPPDSRRLLTNTPSVTTSFGNYQSKSTAILMNPHDTTAEHLIRRLSHFLPYCVHFCTLDWISHL